MWKMADLVPQMLVMIKHDSYVKMSNSVLDCSSVSFVVLNLVTAVLNNTKWILNSYQLSTQLKKSSLILGLLKFSLM